MDVPIVQDGDPAPSQSAHHVPPENHVVSVQKPPLPQEVLKAGGIYFVLGNAVQIIMILLALTSFTASLVVATFSDTFPEKWMMKSVAFTAALTAGILSLFNLQKKNQEIWAAWRMLNAAILRYQYVPDYTRAELLAVWEQAEKTLGNATIKEK